MREPIVAEYRLDNRGKVVAAMAHILETEKIPIARTDISGGIIVTDSFEVEPEYCDCGMNFFGAQYPGTRRGKMRIVVSGNAETRIKFEFGTLLAITANKRQVKCTSFGVLEERLLTQLDKALGAVRVNAQD